MKNLYVGNLPHSTTESELRGVFEAHGAVEKVSLVTDRETGRSRGFAFVETINEAKPKTDRPKTGQRFGGGGGGRNRDDYRGHARQPREPRW